MVFKLTWSEPLWLVELDPRYLYSWIKSPSSLQGKSFFVGIPLVSAKDHHFGHEKLLDTYGRNNAKFTFILKEFLQACSWFGKQDNAVAIKE